jgi:hypothetical protein
VGNQEIQHGELFILQDFAALLFNAVGEHSSRNTNGVTWLFPTTGLILNYQDTVNVTWTSPFPKPLFYTFYFNVTNNCAIDGIRLSSLSLFTLACWLTKIEASQKVTPYNGSLLIQLVWKGVPSCNFDLRPNPTAENGTNTPVFVVPPSAKAVPTTVGLGSPIRTNTAMSTATGTGDSSGTPNTSSNNGLSSGAKAGIGVGVAVIAITIIAGLIFFFLPQRRSKNLPEFTTIAPANGEENYGGRQKYQPMDSTTGSDVQMQEMNAETSTPKPGELSSDVAHELSGAEMGR